ncbi:hypothetical protein [Nocardia flavorosea]|uniref:Uncharacterized protein n=1 Tax=Nocardia flavorosea TaxID=53429 RepID=A0A846YN13_9NOCA|nr:hypothetical protein [Nocardia flavorosea]NKY58299.1 hypothetical protein [Nocardia flavorosea]
MDSSSRSETFEGAAEGDNEPEGCADPDLFECTNVDYGVIRPLRETPPEYAAVYERRGLKVPFARSRYDPASLWPYLPRGIHERHAKSHGYFWLPCPLCRRYYGGHEIVDSIPHEDDSSSATTICPACSARRNGGMV